MVVVSAASSLLWVVHSHISSRVGGRCRIMAACRVCKVFRGMPVVRCPGLLCLLCGSGSVRPRTARPCLPPPAAARASLRAATSRLYPPSSSSSSSSSFFFFFFFCRTRKFISPDTAHGAACTQSAGMWAVINLSFVRCSIKPAPLEECETESVVGCEDCPHCRYPDGGLCAARYYRVFRKTTWEHNVFIKY